MHYERTCQGVYYCPSSTDDEPCIVRPCRLRFHTCQKHNNATLTKSGKCSFKLHFYVPLDKDDNRRLLLCIGQHKHPLLTENDSGSSGADKKKANTKSTSSSDSHSPMLVKTEVVTNFVENGTSKERAGNRNQIVSKPIEERPLATQQQAIPTIQQPPTEYSMIRDRSPPNYSSVKPESTLSSLTPTQQSMKYSQPIGAPPVKTLFQTTDYLQHIAKPPSFNPTSTTTDSTPSGRANPLSSPMNNVISSSPALFRHSPQSASSPHHYSLNLRQSPSSPYITTSPHNILVSPNSQSLHHSPSYMLPSHQNPSPSYFQSPNPVHHFSPRSPYYSSPYANDAQYGSQIPSYPPPESSVLGKRSTQEILENGAASCDNYRDKKVKTENGPELPPISDLEGRFYRQQ